MLLKEIQLKNIRSYVELQPFQFPEGTSLFYGGVGSGKSSLLYAIEFALFGLGELKGPDLLRNSAAEGFVSLAFEEDGKDYVVYRKLHQRKATVSQVEGTISEDGESCHYDSVTEMNLRVLEILKLNEKPRPGTSSVIYRYGIFTPQEEIKGIMEASPESRLETLRRAFRLEKYAIARDNAQALSNHLEKVEIKVLEKQAEGLEGKRDQRDSLIKQIEINNNELVRLGDELGNIDDALNTLREREKEQEAALKEIQSCQAQIPLIKEQHEQDEQLVTRLKGELAKSEQERSKSTAELKQLQSLLKPTDKSEEQLEAELKQVEKEQEALAAQRGANKKSLDNYEMLIDKGVCPTCERPIDDSSVYMEKRNKMRQEVNALLDKEREMGEKRRSLDSLLQDLRQYYAKTQNLSRLQEEIDGKTKSIDEKTNGIQRVKSRLSESQKKLSQLEEIVKPNKELLKAFSQTRQQIEEKEDLYHNKDVDIALLKQKNSGLEEGRKRLEDEISKGEAALVRMGIYREVIKYLEQYFIPTIGRIETMVLQKIHESFNDAFQKYFPMIIGFTEIEAYIDEDFSVVIVQGGYETPYYRLSGGERTSLALAYRLALNQLIRKLSKLGRGLLILDEPTEGLSYAQVLNLREVFDDLDCNQIVLVSHEPQFLGFSDRVFRVDKVNHASTISPF
jgi:exonuclease SbcC